MFLAIHNVLCIWIIILFADITIKFQTLNFNQLVDLTPPIFCTWRYERLTNIHIEVEQKLRRKMYMLKISERISRRSWLPTHWKYTLLHLDIGGLLCTKTDSINLGFTCIKQNYSTKWTSLTWMITKTGELVICFKTWRYAFRTLNSQSHNI